MCYASKITQGFFVFYEMKIQDVRQSLNFHLNWELNACLGRHGSQIICIFFYKFDILRFNIKI